MIDGTRTTTAGELRAALSGDLGRVAQIWDGVMIPDGPALTAPLYDLPTATRVDRYVLPEDPNGRGADALGLRPVNGGLTTRGMLEAARDGKLDVLVLLGANPSAVSRNGVMMFTIAKRLSPEQIRDVASYLQGMR